MDLNGRKNHGRCTCTSWDCVGSARCGYCQSRPGPVPWETCEHEYFDTDYGTYCLRCHAQEEPDFEPDAG